MTTATASSATVDKDTKKHQYKDYVHFLGSYKNGKKSDSDYHSSTSSLVSDFSDLNEMPTKSFNEYLHDYNNKKYQPVQPDFIKKTEEPKNIKTEVFIQINNSDISNNDNGQNRDNQIKITIPKPKLDEVDGDPIIKVSVGKLSQKFSSNTNNNNNNTTQKNVLRRTSSITEKTKIFEGKQGDNNASCITKINKENYIEKFPKKVETLTRRNSGHKLNQTFVEIRKQELQNCPRLNGTTSPPYLPSGKIENFKNIEVETAKNNINTKRHSDNNMNKDSSSTNGHTTDPVLCSLPSDALVHARTATLQENIVQVEINGSNCAIPNPPSPPPLPPANLPPRSVTVSPKLSTSSNINPPSFKTTSATLPRAQNGYSTLPKMQNNKNDTVDSSTIDRNDPRMKKMVYGALRGMYGAYHDKANDYLATLPKNRVKKGNGLDSIIDSIAQPSPFVGTGQGFGPSPQPFIVGHIPPVRLKNQTIRKKMDPPLCVQNAMMTKDKKPFTYTPGGIDLSEARSPQLQRRIERNAHLGGVGDIPQHPAPHPPITGPLPPSALAAMRPQPQVQVFPSGPAPPAPMRGGGHPPPPPPPQHGIPPPPPPPSCPLPTQKVQTGDNQILERPDMTKIIPDNPMALLRKTGGPQPRKSLVDQIFEEAGKNTAEPKSPPVQAQQQYQHPQQRIQPGGGPITPVPQQTYRPTPQQQQQQQQYQPQAQSQYQPQPQYQPPVQQSVPAREAYSQPSYQEPVKEQPRYQTPVIERQPTSSPSNGQQDIKTSTAHLGSLYIPPANQQQQKRIVSPPTPPERNLDSPSVQTPPLREAPRPWQAKKPQEEVPAWAKRDNQIPGNVEESRKVSPPASQPQQRWPQARVNEQPSYNQQPYAQQQQQYEQPKYNQQQPYGNRQDANQHQQPIGIRIDIRTKPQPTYQDQPEVENKPNVVYVTQPLVLMHPGPGPQRQPNNQGPSIQGGPKVIQIEGATRGGNDRVPNRQQSWGNNPIQSNSFKVLQKFTNTDGEDEFENVPMTEHSPKYTQNFQQPADQMRRMKINDGEQNITNTFKQVSRGPQTLQPKGPQVRTIPIQIEGDDPPRPYVHPSEQVVPEPKKYTGSSIPSRSFKILQAMTAPNDYANVEEQNEEIPYDEWVYPPHYPPYPYPPYWYDYYHYYHPESYQDDASTKRATARSSTSRSVSPATSGRHTPLPFWGYVPPYYLRPKSGDGGKDTPNTPKPIPPPWYGYDSSYYPSEQESESTDENSVPQEYYYDPYYYHYYYGYPPVYPQYPPRYGAHSDTDSTMNGYSSMDEKGPLAKKSQENAIKKATTPPESSMQTQPTPTLSINEVVTVNTEIEEKIESTTDFESDTETDDEYNNHLQINPLQSMKSITNINDINVYSSDEEPSKEDVKAEESSEGSNEDIDDASSMCFEEDAYPHELSVIMEESERTESRLRAVSVLSDSTTLAERSDTEEDIVDDHKIIESISDEICETSDEKHNTKEDIDESCEQILEENDVDVTNEDDDKNSDESEDWWGIIGNDDDDLPKPRKTQNITYTPTAVDEEMCCNNNIVTEIDADIEENKTLEVTHEDLENVKVDISDSNAADITSISKNEENCQQTNTTEDVDYTEYKVVRRVKTKNSLTAAEKTETKEIKPRPRSIYDSLEDIKSESTGSLIKVDNFVGILEQIQKDSGFWNLNSKLNDEKVNEPIIKFRRTRSVEEKTTDDIEKRFTWTSFENFNKETFNICSDENGVENRTKRFSCGSLEDFKITIQPKETVNGSTNYIKYNSSLSSTPVLENKSNNLNVPIVNEDNNYDTKSSIVGSQTEDSCDTSDSSSSSSSGSEKDDKENSDNLVHLTDESDVKIPTIKDRIQALRESINSRRKSSDEDTNSVVKDKISVNDSTSRSKTASSKSSIKSFEEFSEEEEVDSGVTSDMSRHISDTEEFPELRKLTKYQRAATHSRLFKLLQEECNGEDDADETDNDQHPQRQNLNLRLEETSNNSQTQVNERLVSELVDSLLKLKKGQAFKNLPKEKLYAAAVKILQEDMEIAETPSEEFSSFLSPMRPSTGYSTAVQTPQEFAGNNCDEYKQYYESWNRSEENYDIFPSKAFKVLQEMSSFNKQGGGLGSLIKCPKVLSSKNIHKKLIKLLEESSENSSNPIPDKPPLDTNEVTSAS